MKLFPRWGAGIVGDDRPRDVLSISLNRELISKLDIFPRTVRIGADSWNLLGVGGVWTASAHRRRGHATSLLIQARSIAAKEKGVAGTILFSLENLVPYYESNGYQRHTGVVTMQQPVALDARETLHGPAIPPFKHVVVPDQVAVMTFLIAEWFDPQEVLHIEGLPW